MENKENYSIPIKKYIKVIEKIKRGKDEALLLALGDLADMGEYQVHEFWAKANTQEFEQKIRGFLRVIAKKILPICKQKIQKAADSDVGGLYKALHRRFWALVAFRSLEHFAYYMDLQKPRGKEVWKYSMPSMRGIFYHANRMILGSNVRLLRASCPVSYGKTYAFNLTSVYALGVYPHFRVLIVTESDSLVKGIVRNCKRMMLSKEYAEVFPECKKYNGDENAMFSNASLDCLILSQSSETYSLTATTRLGASNGLRCDLLILDDLTKGAKDSDNVKLHREIVEQFDNVWNARSDGVQNNRIIAGGTMWAEFDLLNVLRKRVADKQSIAPDERLPYTEISEDGNNIFVSVPNLDFETDESTLPNKYPTEYLRNLRDNILSQTMWWARCQQRPLPPEGLYFSWDRLKTYDVLPNADKAIHLAMLDPARKGKNYVCALYFRKIGDYLYFIDCIYQKEDMKKIIDLVVNKIIKHDVCSFRFENNTDTSLGILIKDRLKARGYLKCSVKGDFSSKIKEDKIFEYREPMREYIIYPKKGMYARNSEMGLALEHLTTFSFERKAEYDDAPDAFAMAASCFCSNMKKSNTIEFIDRRMVI